MVIDLVDCLCYTRESDSQVGASQEALRVIFGQKKPSPFSRRWAAPVDSMDVLSTLIVSARKFYFDLLNIDGYLARNTHSIMRFCVTEYGVYLKTDEEPVTRSFTRIVNLQWLDNGSYSYSQLESECLSWLFPAGKREVSLSVITVISYEIICIIICLFQKQRAPDINKYWGRYKT